MWLVFCLVAGTPVCDARNPDLCSMPMAKGEVAPYAGQLLTPKLAIDLGMKAENCDAKSRLDLERVSALAKLDMEGQVKLREIEANAAKEREDLLRKKLEEAAPRWYEKPLFVAAVSVTVTVVGYALAMRSVGWAK